MLWQISCVRSDKTRWSAPRPEEEQVFVRIHILECKPNPDLQYSITVVNVVSTNFENEATDARCYCTTFVILREIEISRKEPRTWNNLHI
jgi:hypothetical protein